MSVVIPYTFVAGQKARASEVNANFAALSAKFTEGAGGIKDEDISSSAGIRRTKLSTVAGSRITEAQLEDDAVDSRVLKDDAGAGSPNAAVGTADHIKDAIITNAKMANATLKSGKMALSSVTIAIPSVAANTTVSVATGLLSTTAFPMGFSSEGVGVPTGAFHAPDLQLHLDTATSTYYMLCSNHGSVATAGIATLRIHYLPTS